MFSHPVHYFITIQVLGLHVCAVIVCMVVHIITYLEYEILDVVSTKYVQCTIIKMGGVAILED